MDELAVREVVTSGGIDESGGGVRKWGITAEGEGIGCGEVVVDTHTHVIGLFQR